MNKLPVLYFSFFNPAFVPRASQPGSNFYNFQIFKFSNSYFLYEDFFC